MATDVLADILRRLTRLEQEVSAPPGEQLSPNYLTIDPVTGLVGADFTGHVHAEGLDLTAAVTLSPIEDRISWIRASDGTVAADLAGFANGALTVNAYAPTQASQSVAQLEAADDQGTGQAILQVRQTNRGAGQTDVVAIAGSHQPTIIDAAGASNLAQLPSALKTQTLFGAVSAAGAITGTSSSGFTVTNTSAGLYTITFSGAFADIGYGVGLSLQNAQGSIVGALGGKAAGSYGVATYNTSSVLTNAAFNFVACGVAS